MEWEVDPEPADDEERAVLLAAAEDALAPDGESAWWRSGFDDLGWGAPVQEARSDSGVVEP